jgi:hypothetical protein
MLLRNKADPEEKDKEGKTALQYAEEAGKADIVKALKEAMGDDFEDEFEESPVTSPVAQTRELPAEVAAPAASAPTEAEESKPAVQIDAPPAEPAAANDSAIEENIGWDEPASPPAKGHGSGDMQDLKARTTFSKSTTDGVLKRTTFIHKLSTYQSAPEITIASRGENMFARSSVGPSPGSYNLPHEEKSRFRTSSRFSFGGSSRFGLGPVATKQQPGPGQYNPKDPSLLVETKVGFGTSVRNKGAPASQANPGPGAYESRSTVGGGLMFTARGRSATSYMRSRSLPGPGTYAPTLQGAYQTAPKCGFGTSVRGDFGGGSRAQPGPGTYEVHNFRSVGKDSKKFSATSRRKMHDLSSYVTPGPGTYNAHATSFGSPGAYSCKHVDEGYVARNTESHE